MPGEFRLFLISYTTYNLTYFFFTLSKAKSMFIIFDSHIQLVEIFKEWQVYIVTHILKLEEC